MRRILLAAAIIAASAACATAQDTAPPGSPGNPPTVYAHEDMRFTPTPQGERVQLREGPSRTLAELEVHITTLNAGQSSHAPHRHVNEEVIVLQTGRLEVYVNGQTKLVGPGSVFVFLSNDWHSVRNIGDTPATYQVINFRP